MAHKILITLDSSAGAWRAVEYVAQAFGQTPGVEITLLHILPGLPQAFWDEGHIHDENEKEATKRLVVNWQKEQEKSWVHLVQKARERLVAAKIPAATITSKIKPAHFNVAEDIADEARDGGYSTVVMGRRGLGTVKSILLGSVTNKVVQNASGFAVIIAE